MTGAPGWGVGFCLLGANGFAARMESRSIRPPSHYERELPTGGGMPSRKSFSGQCEEGCELWEDLRRNPFFRTEFQVLVNKNQLQMDDEGVVEPPLCFGLKLQRYLDFCDKWGLRILIHYDKTIPLDEMEAFPIFKHIPSRRSVLREEVLSDPLKKNKFLGTANLTKRRRREFFRKGHAPDRSEMLPRARRWDRRFPLYRKIWDLRQTKVPDKAIARRLGVSIDQVKKGYKEAERLIKFGKLVPSIEEARDHMKNCQPCREGNFCSDIKKYLKLPKD